MGTSIGKVIWDGPGDGLETLVEKLGFHSVHIREPEGFEQGYIML